jgi:arylsulfatase A-like enzyme
MRIRRQTGVIALLLLSATSFVAAAERPNFVIILADDMGYSDAGCYGGEIRTPNIDKLALNGLRFTEFYNCSRCCPTRATLLTGKYAHEVGLHRNGLSLSQTTPTIAELLREAGYQTGMVGKWHLTKAEALNGGGLNTAQHLAWLNHQEWPGPLFGDPYTYPAARGFQKHFGIIWGVTSYFDPFSLVDGFDAVRDVPDDFYMTDAITDHAVEYIEGFSKQDKPFLLYTAFTAPHWPLHAREEDIAKYDDAYEGGWPSVRASRYKRQLEAGLIDKERFPLPAAQPEDADWSRLNDRQKAMETQKMRVHAAMVDRMDQGIGRIIKALEETGKLDNTLIVFLSDNGASPEVPSVWGPGYDRQSETRDGRVIRYGDVPVDELGSETTYAGIGPAWANASNTPFRYWKKESFEGGNHTPCIVHWPARLKTKPGSLTDRVSHVMDLAPTVLELAGIAYPDSFRDTAQAPMRGKSLAPTLHGSEASGHETLFFEHEGGAAVRSGDWKLVRLNPRRLWELYDLSSDRTETQNIANREPERVKELSAAWERWYNEVTNREAPAARSSHADDDGAAKAEPTTDRTRVGDQQLYNFIVILADDQGWGTTSLDYAPDVPASKSDFCETPRLERLARHGIRFTQAYSAHPNCSPSRAALLTGCSPAALHLTDIIERHSGPFYDGNRLIPPPHVGDMPTEPVTIPELLKAKYPQYRAAHFGKWHLRGGGPERHGFDSGDGLTSNAPGGERKNLPDDPKQCFGITSRGIDWMRERVQQKEPFYMQLSHYATHLPFQSQPKTRAHFRNKTPGERHKHIRYAAMLKDLDTAVGTVLDEVESLGIADRTYVIYTADNGTYPIDRGANLNGPVRGWKATLWEGGVRVPFIVQGPRVRQGAVSATPVIGTDILPTIADLAGIGAWPGAVEGGSLKPILFDDGADRVQRPRDFLAFHWPHYQHQKESLPESTIIAGDYKLHLWWETEKTQLFNLNDDLAEEKDIAQEMPENARELERALRNYLDAIHAPMPRKNPDFQP